MKALQVLILTVCLSIQGYSQTDLMDVKSWGYWLQSIDIQPIADDSSFELIVMDYSPDGLDSQKWTVEEVNSIKNSGKYAISYISIGEAEDYRYYWQSSWASSPPSWLGPENPNWEGNFAVRFWEPEWQAIVFDYLDTIIMQGFDGIYMDLIDGYYYWSEINPEQPLADSLMCQFVIDIRNYCDSLRGDKNFILIPQNGADIWEQENISSSLKSAYFDAINAIGVEDVFFNGPLDEDNDYTPDTYRIEILQQYLLNSKQVFAIDYLTAPEKISQFVNAATEENFIPYVCTRPLEFLCSEITFVKDKVETNSNNDIFIYPNPASEYVTIKLSESSKLLESWRVNIYNSLGESVMETVIHPMNSIYRLNISTLPNGIYTVVIQIDNEIITEKYVVVR